MSNTKGSNNLKIVVVGDGAVGKTCMLICYAKNVFPEDYIPTVFDNFETAEMYKNKAFNLALWDTAGQEDYDRLRPMSYPEANIVLICFSLVENSSLNNVEEKWMPEVKKHLEGKCPVLLVGTKKDLRDDEDFLRELSESGKAGVTTEEGQEMATKIGAAKYAECSAKTGDGLKEVFIEAIRTVVDPEPIKKGDGGGGCCVIL